MISSTEPNIPVIAAVIAAICAPLVAYITAARKLSGNINTSAAEELWEESRSIREEYRTLIEKRDERIVSLEVKVSELSKCITNLEKENLRCSNEVATLKALLGRKDA